MKNRSVPRARRHRPGLKQWWGRLATRRPAGSRSCPEKRVLLGARRGFGKTKRVWHGKRENRDGREIRPSGSPTPPKAFDDQRPSACSRPLPSLPSSSFLFLPLPLPRLLLFVLFLLFLPLPSSSFLFPF